MNDNTVLYLAVKSDKAWQTKATETPLQHEIEFRGYFVDCTIDRDDQGVEKSWSLYVPDLELEFTSYIALEQAITIAESGITKILQKQ